MKVCVFGAGAIGGHLALRLARGGAEVSVVARGAQLAAIRDRGLTVRAKDGTFTERVAASDDAAALGKQDAVVVTVKAPALPSVAAGIAPLLGPDTPVAFVMNGIPWWYFHRSGGPHDGRRVEEVDPDGAVWRAVGPDRAIGGVVYSACTVVEPGVIAVENPVSRVILGEPDGRVSPRAEALGAAMRAGGLQIEVTPRIRDALWAKLLMNLSGGPIGVATQASSRAYLEQPAIAAAAARAVAEGAAIAEAMGCRIDPSVLTGGRRALAHKASVVQDLELGRPMEIAALFDVPLALARLMGVETPTLDLLVAIARVRAEGAGLYQARPALPAAAD